MVVFVVDATQPFGRGDRWVAERIPDDSVLVVNKIDAVKPDQVLRQLAATAELELSEYFPVSARTGEGVGELVEHLASRMPEGPQYFPPDMIPMCPRRSGWPSS